MSLSERQGACGAVTAGSWASPSPARPTLFSVFEPAGLLAVGITALLAVSALAVACWWIGSGSRPGAAGEGNALEVREAVFPGEAPPDHPPDRGSRVPRKEPLAPGAADPLPVRLSPPTPPPPLPAPKRVKAPSPEGEGAGAPVRRPPARELLIRLSPQEQQQVSQAVRRGAAFLKEELAEEVAEHSRSEGRLSGHAVGRIALAGLTLLECGLPSGDAAVQGAASQVRDATPNLKDTYSLSLAILFLDRLGAPEDEQRLQTFALRLIAGQNRRGGWTYACPLLDAPAQRTLLTRLRELPPLESITSRPEPPELITRRPAGAPDLPAQRLVDAPRDLPRFTPPPTPALEPLDRPASPSSPLDPVVAQSPPVPGLITKTAPSSNPDWSGARTNPGGPDQQKVLPAMTALEGPVLRSGAGPRPKFQKGPSLGPEGAPQKAPAAERHPRPPELEAPSSRGSRGGPTGTDGEPLPATLTHVPALHFQPGGDWPSGDGRLKDDNSNTQFAILGLWAARRHGVPMDRTLALVERRFRLAQNADGSWGYQYNGAQERDSMTCTGLLGMALSLGLEASLPGRKPEQGAADPAVHKGLAFLGGGIGRTTPPEPRKGPGKRGSRPGKRSGGLVGAESRGDLYYLWSVERVAVAYGLRTIGDKDWYRWGAGLLVASQAANGGWKDRYAGIPDTSFALLFLTRANLAWDLPQLKAP